MGRRKEETIVSNEVLDELVKSIASEEDFTAVMRQLSKGLLERVLEAEMTEHLGHDSGGIVSNAEGNTRMARRTKLRNSKFSYCLLVTMTNDKKRMPPRVISNRSLCIVHRRMTKVSSG